MKKLILSKELANKSLSSWRRSRLRSHIIEDSNEYKELQDLYSLATAKIKEIIVEELLDEESKYMYENFPEILKTSCYISLSGYELEILQRTYSEEGCGAEIDTDISLQVEIPNNGNYTFRITKDMVDKLSESSRAKILDVVFDLIVKEYAVQKLLWNGKVGILSGVHDLGQLFRLNEDWYAYLVKKEWGEDALKFEEVPDEEDTKTKPDRSLIITNNQIRNREILEELKSKLDI